VASALALCARGVEVGTGRIAAGRVRHAGVEELVLDGADPASDVKQGRTSTPSVFSASSNARVEAIGPFARYLRSFVAARFSS
jgi:hypothetical protein